MGTNIWGKGGLFEQRAAMAQEVDANQMANRTAATGIAQQNADTDRTFVNNRGAIDAFGADTDRMGVDKRFDPATEGMGGLRGLGKSAGGSGAATLFNQDGSVLGIRGSAVGAGSSSVPGLSSPLTNSFVKETQDSAPGDRAAATGSNSFTEKKPGFQKGGRVDTYSPKPGTTVHRMPRGLPRVIESPGARDVPRTDKEMERDRQMAEQAIDEGMQRGAAKFANPKYPDDAKGLRGYAKGGCVTPKRKMNQPGYAKGGKIMMPPEAPGAIGDVEMDTGTDVVDAKVRHGEVLLNPETVAFAGGGDYEQGVRMFEQLIRQATGEEPGPEPVGKSEGGEPMLGYGRGARVVTPEIFYGDSQYGLRPNLNTGIVPFNPLDNLNERINVGSADDVLQGRTGGKAAWGEGASPEARAWDAEQTRPAAEPAPKTARGAAAEQWSKSNPNVTSDGLRSTAKAVGNTAKYALKPVEWAVKGGSKAMPYVAPAFEAADITDVATDPNMNKLDTAEQVAESTAKLATMGIGAKLGATGGAALGTMIAPGPGTAIGTAAGGLIGGAAGYFGGDAAIDTARGWLPGHNGDGSSPSERSNGVVSQMLNGEPRPQQPAANEAPPAAYGRAFGDRSQLNLPHPDTLYAASMPVPGQDARVVQRTGGPGDEVIIREDKGGVPTFTNLRRGGFDGSAANLQKEADARVADDYATGLRNQKVMDQMREAAPAYTDREANIRRDDANALRLAEIEASGRGSSSKSASDDLMKNVSGYFTQQVRGEDGSLEKSVPDDEAARTFMDSMSRMVDPDTGRPMTEVLEAMTPGQRAPFLADFERVFKQTKMAMAAASAQRRPFDDRMRTGEDGLRLEPTGREIVLGDVIGPDATIGDWWAGLGNDAPELNRYVEDPRSGAVMPARRVTNEGMDAESMRRLGLL